MPRKRTGEVWIGREPGRPGLYLYFYDAGTQRVRRRATGTEDRILAEEARLAFLKERAVKVVDSAGPLPPEKCLVSDVLRQFGDERGPELASGEQIGYAIVHLVGHFGLKRVAELTPRAVKGYETHRTNQRRARGTIRRELAVLASALTHAVRNERLTTAPRIFLPAPGPGRTRFLDEAEIGALLHECLSSWHLYVFAQIALNTGARRGAILDLTWLQVQFDQNLIYLNPPEREQTSKTRATVPMSPTLRETLAFAWNRPKRSPFVVSYNGMRISDIKTALGKAVKRAGLEGVSTHTLRHTAGSIMAKNGVPLYTISKMLGHSDTKTTELYAHLRPEWLGEGADALGRATSFRPLKRHTGKNKGLPE